MNVSYMKSFRGYDLTILDEPTLVAGVATPDSGLASRLLVCTESSLLELRKRKLGLKRRITEHCSQMFR